MNPIGTFIKQKRKEARLTQEEFAMRSGLGLRFVRELEQGKETVRLDKVNQALAMFGMEAAPRRKERPWPGRGAENRKKAHPFYGKCHKVDFIEKGVLWIKDDEEDIQGIKKYRIETKNFPKRKAHGLF